MKKNLLLTALAIIVGTLLLRIFIPWWLISLLMGAIAVLATYAWTTENTSIPAPWARKILLVVTVVFAISLAMSFVAQKWPWLDKALDDGQLYSSFRASDLVDPKYPDSLARNIYQTERMRIRNEEKHLNALLAVTQQKLADGIPLTVTDQAVIKRAKERLAELDKELASINLAREKKTGGGNKPIGSWPWRLVVLGAILLAGVMFIPVKFALPGKKLLGLIGAIVLMAGLVFVFFPEIADLGDRPRQAAARPATAAVAAYATQLPANAVFVKNLAPGEKTYVTRANMDAAPPKFWAKFDSGFVETFDSWPQTALHRFAFNNTSQSYAFYVALVPGQSFTTSTADPALVPRADQQASAGCPMDQIFGPK